MPTRTNTRQILFLGIAALGLVWLGPAAGAAGLSPEELRGKQIYLSGTSPSGAEITAHLGVDGFGLPASAMPCASCHGADGRGRPEGGVIPSDITWTYLSRSYGHQHSYGREHPAFTGESLARAISTAIDPAGNRLDVAMPAYRMAQDDLDALITYLTVIETDYDAGITADAIRIATLLPLSGQAASLGNAMHAVLQAYVDDLNSTGGINGRAIGLEVIPFGAGPQDALRNLQQSLEQTGIFALLAPYAVGLESELASLAEREQIPVVGPYTLRPPAEVALARYTFYLFSGLEHQMQVLVDLATEQFEGQPATMAVAGADDESTAKLTAAIARHARTKHWPEPRVFSYVPGGSEIGQLATELRTGEPEILFFLGRTDELDALLTNLATSDRVPMIFLPADRVTRSLLNAPSAFDGRIFSAYPRSPADVTAAGRQAYAALRDKYELSGDQASAQFAVLAASATFSEGLRRAGKELSRESFINSLESLHEYETGYAQPVTYTLNRRIGALGAHAVRIDLARKTFVSARTWKDLN